MELVGALGVHVGREYRIQGRQDKVNQKKHRAKFTEPKHDMPSHCKTGISQWLF